jgi:hypothetical protein
MKKYLIIGASILIYIFSFYAFYAILPIFGVDSIGGEDMFGATITTIQGSDTIKDSRSVINTNFSNLNNDKIEVSTTSLPVVTTMNGLTTAPNLNTIGTITTGTWHADYLTIPYGGTGSTTLSSNQLLFGNGTGNLKVIGYGTSGQYLTSGGYGAIPSWITSTIDEGIAYDWTGNHSFTEIVADDITVASTTITKGTVNDAPTTYYGLANKGYVDTTASGKIVDYNHTSETVNMTTAGRAYLLKTEIGVGSFTMGANDTAEIMLDIGTNGSSGNTIITVDIGTGSASTTILSLTNTDYGSTKCRFTVMNRNSVSSQLITTEAFYSTNLRDSSVYTSSLNLSNGFNVYVWVSNSVQSSLVGTSRYYDVRLFKP